LTENSTGNRPLVKSHGFSVVRSDAVGRPRLRFVAVRNLRNVLGGSVGWLFFSQLETKIPMSDSSHGARHSSVTDQGSPGKIKVYCSFCQLNGGSTFSFRVGKGVGSQEGQFLSRGVCIYLGSACSNHFQSRGNQCLDFPFHLKGEQISLSMEDPPKCNTLFLRLFMIE